VTVRFDERLFAVPATAHLRRAAARILTGALDAVDPHAATLRAITREGVAPSLAAGSRVIVVGAGKAGAPMARAVEDALGNRIEAGLVTVKTGYTTPLPLRRIGLREAGHPIPDAAGEAAAREILRLVSGLNRDDVVIVLVSGGGSALLPLPQEGVSLGDMVRTTDLLLRSGATITEVNTVRKHLSRIAGGQLARAAAPARLVTLIVSDVVGSPLDAIASGPTVPDPTTYSDALRVLDRYRITEQVPAAVLETLKRGAAAGLPETPKPGDPLFSESRVVVVAENGSAARAALAEARRLGFHGLLLSTFVQGEAREIGRAFAGIARQVAATGEPVPSPACIVAGGETTVTVTGAGRGGRNQEIALSAALVLEGIPDALLVSFATDGTDGPTDAAGGVADGTTAARVRSRGLDPARRLADNDAYAALDAAGDLIRTGPTNTNVTDLMLILCGPPHPVPPLTERTR
jgi:glycerate 2-kinase